MANVAKYQASQTGRMCAHYERAPDCFGNEYIDSSRTNLNYNLAAEDQKMNQIDFIKKRKSEVKHSNRKDLKTMCDWCVTLPKNVKPGDERKFFEETYKFLNDRYGKENVISAYVHNDESTPHMHYAFIPVVYDRELGAEKISAKELINLSELRRFHGELQAHLEKEFGYDVGVSNNSTSINLNLRKYKELMKEMDKIRDEVNEIEEEELEMNPLTRTYKREGVEKLIDQDKALKQENLLLKKQNQSLNSTLIFVNRELKKYKDKSKKYNYEELVGKYEELKNKSLEKTIEAQELRKQMIELKNALEYTKSEKESLEQVNITLENKLREYEEEEIRNMPSANEQYEREENKKALC